MTHLNEDDGNSKEDSILNEDSRMGKDKSKENLELSGLHCRSGDQDEQCWGYSSRGHL